MATTEELQRHASEADADGDAEHARHSAVTELRAALEDAESYWGLGTQTKRRLRVETDAYSSRYKMLSRLEGWDTIVEESKEHVQWLTAWLGKRKAPKSEAPQRMEIPRRSKAGNAEDDTHKQKYEDKGSYEAGGQDIGGSDGDAPEGSQGEYASTRAGEGRCGCQGPDGPHRCEEIAVGNERCELCLLGPGMCSRRRHTVCREL